MILDFVYEFLIVMLIAVIFGIITLKTGIKLEIWFDKRAQEELHYKCMSLLAENKRLRNEKKELEHYVLDVQLRMQFSDLSPAENKDLNLLKKARRV